MPDYDVLIIGAGMSGLAAGVRLAQYERRVLIVERHSVYGGLNSFYTLDGRRFDVGLHALTNYVPAGVRQAPLAKLLRQLRITRESLELCEQRGSAISFPDCRLRFNNDSELLCAEVRRAFPREIDRFTGLLKAIRAFDDLDLSATWQSARRRLAEYLHDALLIEMLLCPLMYYGSAEEDDMDWNQFVVLFKSIFLEGFSRPRQGVRRIIAELVKRYRTEGGHFKMGCGVRALRAEGGLITAVELDDGNTLSATTVLSSAGSVETMRLCGAGSPADLQPGRLSFMESVSLLDVKPAELGLDDTIVFFNDGQQLAYRRPAGLIDPRSGVICCPNNYDSHDDLDCGVLRVTSLANYDRWAALAEPDYALAKVDCFHYAADHAVRFVPEFRPHVVYRDIFTPRTIRRFTGHIDGAVYGAPHKLRDGCTPFGNLFICGTDQGFLGIIGACLSGITIANLHVLSRST